MIATCSYCHRLMAGTSCDPLAFRVGGITTLRTRWDLAHPCHDCNVTEGGYHHPGCALDVCQHGQAAFCDLETILAPLPA